MTQQRYLKKLGVQSFIDALQKAPGLSPLAQTANRMAMLELTRVNGFGGFGVMLQTKGMGEHVALDDLVTSRARPGLGSLPIPTLTADYTPILTAKYPHYSDLTMAP